MRRDRIASGAELGEIGPVAESAPGRGQADFLDRFFRSGKREAIEQRIAHGAVDRIERVRAVERETQHHILARQANRAGLVRIMAAAHEPSAMLRPALERGEDQRFDGN